jgi:hypothetical protein
LRLILLGRFLAQSFYSIDCIKFIPKEEPHCQAKFRSDLGETTYVTGKAEGDILDLHQPGIGELPFVITSYKTPSFLTMNSGYKKGLQLKPKEAKK